MLSASLNKTFPSFLKQNLYERFPHLYVICLLCVNQACIVEHEIEIQCPVPGIMNPGVNVTDTSPLEVHYGFNMDGVTTLRNISHHNQFGPILYYPDPDIYTFNGDNHMKKYMKDDWLSIQVLLVDSVW